jgi:hypothetical protein
VRAFPPVAPLLVDYRSLCVLRLAEGPVRAQRIRAVAAVGGLSRCVILTDFPTSVLRAAVVDAACDALGLDAG